MNHSARDEANSQSAASAPRALVIGGGPAASVAAQSMAEMGIDVTLARLAAAQSHLCFAHPSATMEEALQCASEEPHGVEIMDVDSAPVVNRTFGGFRAVFEDGTGSFYDCLLLAPALSLKPVPTMLPEDTELFGSRTAVGNDERTVFLMDYLEPSDAAHGMSAMKLAVQNVLNGGASVVCLKNASVKHLFGEALYEGSRKTGVRFVRFGEQPPHVVSLPVSDGSARFRVSVTDIIDEGHELVLDCDRVISVTGPDPESIPKWAVEMANGELDDRGFLLSGSVHCNSGSSFSSGLFMVGEALGTLDMIGCVTTARAAASKALAGIRRSALAEAKRAISVGPGCAGCLTCYRVCPHRALLLGTESSSGRVEPWLPFCRECGICTSVCPTVAISLKDSPEDSLLALIKDLQPSEMAETTLVLGCRRSAGVIVESIQLPDNTRFLAVPCAGNVSEYMIWSTLAAGAKGVLLAGCHNGNCASHTGTNWAAARVHRGITAGILGQETPRIGYITIAANEQARFQRLLREFVAGCATDHN